MGGRESKPFSLPWVTLMSSSMGSCTSFLIAQNPESDEVGDSSDKVVTAGHCFVNGCGAKNISIVLGTHRADLVESREVRLRVKSVIIHEDYGSSTGRYDIALMQLEKPVKFNEYVRPVALPRDDALDKPTDIPCLAAGWGIISQNHDNNGALNQIPVNIVQCNKEEAQTNWLCVEGDRHEYSGTGGHFGIGAGDSGGPLLCYNRTSDQFMAYGVVSGSMVYTDVRKLKPWIIKAAKTVDNSNVYLPVLSSFHHKLDAPFGTAETETVIGIYERMFSTYRYPEKLKLTEIIDKPLNYGPQSIKTPFDARSGFHFDDIIGYTFEKSVYHCVAACDAYKECSACNYVITVGLCIFLQSATIDRQHTLWSDSIHKSVHIYFTGCKQRAIESDSTSSASKTRVTEPGKPYFKSSARHFIANLKSPKEQISRYRFEAGFRNSKSEFSRCLVFVEMATATDAQLILTIKHHCEARLHLNDPVLIPTVNGKYTIFFISNKKPRVPVGTLLTLKKPSNSEFDTLDLDAYEGAFKQIFSNINVEPHSLPWMAEITTSNVYAKHKKCNGVLLADNNSNVQRSSAFVLTTKKCLETIYGQLLFENDISIKLGSHHNDMTENNELERKAWGIIINSNEHRPIMKNDQAALALILLTDPVPSTKYISPIEVIEDPNEMTSCSKCFVAGWRMNYDCYYAGGFLGKTYVTANNTPKDCAFNQMDAFNDVTVKPSLKIFFDSLRTKACRVNEGAPLICFNENTGKYFVKTFVAQYEPTSAFDIPTISYINMSGVETWINEELESYQKQKELIRGL